MSNNVQTIKCGEPEMELLPTQAMILRALECDTRQAQYHIRSTFDGHVAEFGSRSAPLDVSNQVDGSRPPLSFRFVNEYVFGPGTSRVPDEVIIGCGDIPGHIGADSGSVLRKCRPNMGKNIGCEYSRVCDCLERAAVDTTRLTAAEHAKYRRDDTAGLPKRFPYGRSGLLQRFYLKSRHPIYECNRRCKCGRDCKTRLVQNGRTVPLQIFKTSDGRGWGNSTSS